MAMPKKLKSMLLFNEGNSYVGQCASVTLPKLGRKFESWRGAGMDGPVKVDLGHSDDGIQLEWTLGGWDLTASSSSALPRSTAPCCASAARCNATTPAK